MRRGLVADMENVATSFDLSWASFQAWTARPTSKMSQAVYGVFPSSSDARPCGR
jgi:hypothetical protein